jgi:hypothetical protein
LANIAGRVTNLIALKSGRTISPYRLTSIIETDPAIRRFQGVQVEPGKLRINLVVAHGGSGRRTIPGPVGQIPAVLPEPAGVTAHPVPQIVRRAGKFKVVQREFGGA